MSEQKVTVEAMVEGGKASGGPPIGPALGPTGVNVFQVVTKINEVTQVFAGLKVPVKIIVDQQTKQFQVEVGVPPTSALILKEVNAPKGSGTPNTAKIGNLTFDQLKKIAKAKATDMSAYTMSSAVRIVAGTCVSVGVTIEGKPAKEFIAELKQGAWDSKLNEPLREG